MRITSSFISEWNEELRERSNNIAILRCDSDFDASLLSGRLAENWGQLSSEINMLNFLTRIFLNYQNIVIAKFTNPQICNF